MSTSKEALEKARWTSDLTGVDVSALLVPAQTVLRKPVIVWDDPDPCAYVEGGVTLDGTHLNAVVTPGAGAAVYQPAKGAKLGPGTHQLTATVAAKDKYDAPPAKVKLQVQQARPEIAWKEPTAVLVWRRGLRAQRRGPADLAQAGRCRGGRRRRGAGHRAAQGRGRA